MFYRSLKISRVVISLVVIIVALVIFVDFTGWVPDKYAKLFASLQLIPAALSSFRFVVSAMVVAAAILCLTLLFGRIYCSTICPLGVLQDVIAWVKTRFHKKFHYKPQGNYRKLRYTVLALAVVSFIFSAGYFLSYLDPYSNFGRISAMLFKPAVLLVNNGLALVAQKLGWYSVAHYDYKFPEIAAIAWSVFFLSGLVILSWRGGRIFCNTLCPVGGFLGLIAKRSFYKINIDETACKSCGVCEWKCKAGCIDKETKKVDMERCVMCFNCLDTCPTSVMYLKTPKSGKPASQHSKMSEPRRDMLKSVSLLSLLALIPDSKVIQVYKDSVLKVDRKTPVTPPGSVAAYKFHNTCTACYLCISKCPTQVLQPSVTEYGLQGFMQPVFNFKYGFCNFECNECSQVCPTGALQPVEKEPKKLLQLGVAKFLKDNCVVYTQGTDCGACSEHCPTKAVQMVPYKNLTAPEVTEEYCIGCGACEHACPTKPYKAIYVEGLPLHGKATKKVSKQLAPVNAAEEEFPF